MSDYIPDSPLNRYNWFVNLKTQVNANAVALAIPAAKLTAFNTLITAFITIYKALIDAQAALDLANGNALDFFASNIGDLRDSINEIKNNTLCTDGMKANMQVLTSTSGVDTASIKPSIHAANANGHVRITGTKDHAELVNIYMRIVGTVAWTLVGIKRKKFPFDDQTPLKVAGVPETREYKAHGVINDEEVGLDSDIVSVLFGG